MRYPVKNVLKMVIDRRRTVLWSRLFDFAIFYLEIGVDTVFAQISSSRFEFFCFSNEDQIGEGSCFILVSRAVQGFPEVFLTDVQEV